MPPIYRTLTMTVDPRGVATLTLNRPRAHNALDDVLIAELRDAAARVAAGGIRVAVLTGDGPTFCAGGDFRWFARNLERSREERVAQGSALARMLFELDRLPVPLVGRINGSAYGGGVGMISVCDIAVAAVDARFGLTEVRLGLIPATISPYVVARMGVANCRATMLSGALFDARRAVSLGLLTEAVAADELDVRVDEIVAAHLEAAPGAVAAAKRLIRDVAGRGVEEVMTETAGRLADAWDTEEGRTGIRCFLDRRRPPWSAGE